MSSLDASDSVHGVLGQTYRETAKTYQKLVNGPEYKKLRANGMPFFVDGEENDYETSGEYPCNPLRILRHIETN